MTGPYPPSHQPGNDGWPGGDINSPFGATDPNSPFPAGNEPPPAHNDEPSPYQGVQYELENSTAPPMNQPPYAPVTGPPMSGPPVSGQPMGPGGYGPPQGPPPGYGPQPGYQPPRPSGGSNGLLIGGIIAGVVLLLVVAGVIVIVATSGGSGEPGGSGSQDASSDVADGGSGEYKMVADICDAAGIDPLTAMAELDSDPTQSNSKSDTFESTTCSAYVGDFMDTIGSFNVYVYVFPDESGAQSWYDSSDYSLDGCDVKDFGGNWAQGQIGTGGEECGIGINGNSYTATVLDGNLQMSLSLDLTDDLARDNDGEQVLSDMANNILAASSV
jgi:hypothetical protein